MADRKRSTGPVQQVCAWCGNRRDGFQFKATGGRCGCGGFGYCEHYRQQFRPCTHPGPVVIKALPGAEFRTTTFNATGDALGCKLHPTFTPPRDIGAAFVKACRKAQVMLAALPADATFDTFDQPTATQPVAA